MLVRINDKFCLCCSFCRSNTFSRFPVSPYQWIPLQSLTCVGLLALHLYGNSMRLWSGGSVLRTCSKKSYVLIRWRLFMGKAPNILATTLHSMPKVRKFAFLCLKTVLNLMEICIHTSTCVN